MLHTRKNMLSRARLVAPRAALRAYLSEPSAAQQKEARERAMAEALAREEAALARQKALRGMKEESRAQVAELDSATYAWASERARALQKQLEQLPSEKVRMLNDKFSDFLSANMRLPPLETHMRPWLQDVKPPAPEKGVKAVSTTASSVASNFPHLQHSPDFRPYTEAELHLRYFEHRRRAQRLGSTLSGVHVPKDETKKPVLVAKTTLATLMAAGCHLGHAKALWRPSTQPYIYGEYDGIHLIDLNETLVALKRACRVMRGVAEQGGIILFVGTFKTAAQQQALEEAARRCSGYYVTHKWIPGTVTNFFEVSRQIGGQQEVKVRLDDLVVPETFGERPLMKPDLVVLFNPVENRHCINECIKTRVPTIGLCDTNMEPSLLTYPIPCNDDSSRATTLMAGVLSRSAREGMLERHAIYQRHARDN